MDDGSSDRTAAIAEAFAVRHSSVAVQREPHRGKGGAVKAGLLAATGKFRFICDADLSMPIGEVARFLPPAAHGFDVAIGSREGLRAHRIGEPAYRASDGPAVQSRGAVAGAARHRGFAVRLQDVHRRGCHAIFPRVTVDGWAFDVEVLAMARAQRLRIIEVPIEWHYRAESRLSLVRDGWEMLKELIRIRLRSVRGRYRA